MSKLDQFRSAFNDAPQQPRRFAQGGSTSLKQSAQKLKHMGRYGDTDLVHVNSWEEDMLKKIGGSGKVNPRTGLREYNNPPVHPQHQGDSSISDHDENSLKKPFHINLEEPPKNRSHINLLKEPPKKNILKRRNSLSLENSSKNIKIDPSLEEKFILGKKINEERETQDLPDCGVHAQKNLAYLLYLKGFYDLERWNELKKYQEHMRNKRNQEKDPEKIKKLSDASAYGTMLNKSGLNKFPTFPSNVNNKWLLGTLPELQLPRDAIKAKLMDFKSIQDPLNRKIVYNNPAIIASAPHDYEDPNPDPPNQLSRGQKIKNKIINATAGHVITAKIRPKIKSDRINTINVKGGGERSAHGSVDIYDSNKEKKEHGKYDSEGNVFVETDNYPRFSLQGRKGIIKNLFDLFHLMGPIRNIPLSHLSQIGGTRIHVSDPKKTLEAQQEIMRKRKKKNI